MPVRSVDELYDLLPRAVASRVRATSHVSGVLRNGELESSAPAMGGFSPPTGSILVPRDADARLAAFFEPPQQHAIKRVEAQEIFQLRRVKGDLLCRVRDCLRGTGPADPRMMQLEWDSYWQLPYIHAFTEGVIESAAQLIVNDVITDIGMDRIDTRIATVEPMQTFFHQDAGLVTALATHLAEAVGTKPQTEILDLARVGGAELAFWRFSVRWGLAPDLAGEGVTTAPPALVSLGATMGRREVLQKVFLDATTSWGEVPADRDTPEAEARQAVEFSDRALRGMRLSTRRFLAGGEMPDPRVLGDELAKAGRAAETELEGSLAQVWTALDGLGGIDISGD